MSKINEEQSDASDWLIANQDAEKDEIEYKLKKLQGICDSIFQKVYP